MAEVIAKATDVEVIYGDKPALDKINMSVKKGDIYALIGKNGAGKTTLLRLFTGQNAPDYGSIELFGKKGTHGLNEARKRTGAIIETPAFYPFFSAERNLEYYRIQRGIDDPSIVETVLKETGLYEAKDKKFKNFSLGMKQRLGIALSLMHDPEFLILDEPINDPAGIVEMRKLMLRLNKENGLTIIISSHILSELANMATCYGFIDHGQILQEMSAEELEAKEKSYVKVRTSNGEKAAKYLSKELQLDASYNADEDTIYIYFENNAVYPTEKISRFLFEMGYDLYSLEIAKTTLEDFFIELLGGTTIE